MYVNDIANIEMIRMTISPIINVYIARIRVIMTRYNTINTEINIE